MKYNETTCPYCQQVFKLCECSIDDQIEALHKMSIENYHKEVNKSYSDRKNKKKNSDIYSMDLNVNRNRFRNIK